MGAAAEANPSSVLNKVRRLRAQVEQGLLELREHSEALHVKTAEIKLIYEGTRQAFDLLIAGLQNGAANVPNGEEILGQLSPRQRQVLEQVIAGKPNKAIAFELGLSEKTVESHRARVMHKLHAGSFAELVRISIRAGIGTRA